MVVLVVENKIYLMHGIDVLRATILKSVRIVFVGPNGGDGCVASLSHHAPQRPRVYQVPSENHVLYQNVVVVVVVRLCGVVWGIGGELTH